MGIMCFYHASDLDGICSAAIVYYKYPNTELFPINYGEPFPWEKIERNDTVYMVDFGLQPIEDMVRLDKMCNLIWIDHHITAIKAAEEIGFNPLGILDISKAGCELTWQYCFPDKILPKPVYWLGRYDVWVHDDEFILPFQYGMRLRNWAPDCGFWKSLFEESFIAYAGFQGSIIEDGYLIMEWEKIQNAQKVENSFEVEFEGLRAVVCNGEKGSPLFDSVYNIDKHDIMISFIYTKNKVWTYGLYSTKSDVNCGEIAKRYGGGGHFSASGFQSDKFLF